MQKSRMDLSQLQAEIQKLAADRIVVVGAPGSGKSSIAGDLAQELSLVHIQADDFFWSRSGEAVPLAEFKEKIRFELARHEKWIFEGHFKSCHAIVLAHNPLVIELPKGFWSSFADYSLRELRRGDLSGWQKFKRYFLFLQIPAVFSRLAKRRFETLKEPFCESSGPKKTHASVKKVGFF